MKKLLFFLIPAAIFCSCSVKDAGIDDPSSSTLYDEGGDGGVSNGGGEGQEGGEAGKVTAGEWRDLDNWLFWSKLMTVKGEQGKEDYTKYSSYWGFYTNNRVAVRVLDSSDKPQRDVAVQLKSGSDVLYEGRTDNRGEVNLWVSLTKLKTDVDASSLSLVVNGAKQEKAVALTNWGDEVQWNTCTASIAPSTALDIAFIVDATGSMMDEIDFLKKDLEDIIGKVAKKNTAANIRTAALFYRDHDGDDYVTRVSDFSNDLSVTKSFINDQSADGGGDYPEAVHTALEVGLQQLSWREDGCIRLAFMLLDAPPHHEENVVQSLQQSIPNYAKKGIRIIPVAASGVDKPTEFFLRFAAISTDATYVFITNHSGIGNEHMEATVGQYKVEMLNDLIVRLINQYMQ